MSLVFFGAPLYSGWIRLIPTELLRVMAKLTIIVDEKQDKKGSTFLALILTEKQKLAIAGELEKISRKYKDIRFHAAQDKFECTSGFNELTRLLGKWRKEDLLKERILERSSDFKESRRRVISRIIDWVNENSGPCDECICLFDYFSESTQERRTLQTAARTIEGFRWQKVKKHEPLSKLIGVADYILYLDFGKKRKKNKKK